MTEFEARQQGNQKLFSRTDRRGKRICVGDRVVLLDGTWERVQGWTSDGYVIHGNGWETHPRYLRRL